MDNPNANPVQPTALDRRGGSLPRENCPLCKTRPKWNGVLSHSPDCPAIDLDSAKWYAARAEADRRNANERVATFVQAAQRWEGKFRVVCHENNQLRRKLSEANTELTGAKRPIQ